MIVFNLKLLEDASVAKLKCTPSPQTKEVYMFSVKQKKPSHKPRTAHFILEAIIPPLILISSSLIHWSNLFSRANLFPSAVLIFLWVIASVLIWIRITRG